MRAYQIIYQTDDGCNIHTNEAVVITNNHEDDPIDKLREFVYARDRDTIIVIKSTKEITTDHILTKIID
jgi:hypothetical protein